VAIRRGKVPADEFTIISNALLRDPQLSWKAKGLLAYIMSHAADYSLSTEQIIAEGKDSRDAVRAGLRELEDAGLLLRVPLRDEHGRTAGYDYEVISPTAGWAGDGQAGAGNPVAGAEQPKEDVSAGETSDGFSGAGKSPPKKTTSQKTKKNTSETTSPRGARVPDPFPLTEELKEWARENAPGIGWGEHEKFMDYWRGAPGQRGVKLDWPATWRNWMRKAAEQRGARPVSGPPRQEFKSAAERKHERDAYEMERYTVADQLAEQRGTPIPRFGTPEHRAFFAEVDKIHGTLMRNRQASGYTNGDVIDAEVIDTTVPEVTA
jgi:hypothetical protein